MKNVLLAGAFMFTFACICSVGVYLNEKIDAMDEAIFQHMKDEFNEKVKANE